MNHVTFDFLCWVERCIFFRNDTYKKLIELGSNEDDAYWFVNTEGFKQKSLLKIYQDYCLSPSDYQKTFFLIIDDYYCKYNSR